MARILFVDGTSKDLSTTEIAIVQGVGRKLANEQELKSLVSQYQDKKPGGAIFSPRDISRFVSKLMAPKATAQSAAV